MQIGTSEVELLRKIEQVERENVELKAKLNALGKKNKKRKPAGQHTRTTSILRENEERLRAMFEHTGDGILLISRACYKISFANQSFCSMLGLTKEELIGMRIQDAHPNVTQPWINANLQNAEPGKVKLLENLPIIRRNGAVFFADIQVTCLRIAGADYWMADYRDVTERKRAEDDLKLNELRLNSLLELSQKAHTLSEQEITQAAIEESIRLTRSEIGYIYFSNRAGQSIECASWADKTKTSSQTAGYIHSLLERNGLWTECIQNQKPIIKNDCRSKSGKLMKGSSQDSTTITRLAMAPILDKSEIVLVIAVGNNPEAYDEDDIKQLQLIGYQLARILERKQAEVALERYAKEQAALYAVTSAASAFLDPDHLLTTILKLVLTLPGISADFGWIFLLEDWPHNTPRLVATNSTQEPMPREQLAAWQCHCDICGPLLNNQEPSPQTIPTMPCFAPTFHCPGSHDINSHIAVPIRTGKRTLGIIILAWRTPNPFTYTDYALLMAIGRQVGLALRNAQLYQAAAQSNRLKVLNALSTAAGSSLEMDVVLKQVLELTCNAVQAASGAILRLDPNHDYLTFSRAFGQNSDSLQGKKLSIGEGIAGWVARNRQIACVNDVHQDERWFPTFDDKNSYFTRSILCAPLLYRGEVTGVIEVLNKQNEDFTQEDVNLLESVAAIISVAMENARLFAATRARAQELETLIQIEMTLTASLDIKGVIQNALSLIPHLFSVDRVALLRLDEPAQEIVYVHALLASKYQEASMRVVSEDNSAVAWAFTHREAVLITDTTADPLLHEPAVEMLLGAQSGSIMLAPMLSSNKMVGVMLVASSEIDHFTEANLHTLQAITATLTIALENAGLYENLKALLHERELTQANIVQTEKMVALGQLSASIAHEINNPLQAIQGCLTLFGEEMNDTGRKVKLEHYLSIVQSEIERITTIVSRMKDYYRPEKEGLQPIDLHASLDAVLELTNKKLQQNHISVNRNWSEKPIILQANQDRLRQVFLNLILNAMDAMPGGGVLSINTCLDRIERNDGFSTSAMRIEFVDTGIGMTPDIQSNIFEPFFTTKEYGSGLGLYIVYGIIHSHQGTIQVSSKPGLGTTFSILLPLQQA